MYIDEGRVMSNEPRGVSDPCSCNGGISTVIGISSSSSSAPLWCRRSAYNRRMNIVTNDCEMHRHDGLVPRNCNPSKRIGTGTDIDEVRPRISEQPHKSVDPPFEHTSANGDSLAKQRVLQE